jgi:WXG100 family type VII secretion target
MSMTQAEAGTLIATAQRFDTVREALDARLRRLMGELDVLHSQWQGAGGRSFAQVKAAWAADQAQINTALTTTAEAMRASAGGYRDVDTGVSSRFQAPAGATVQLPL